MRPPTGIITDIEGTTTRIAFVRDVLFPFARARLPQLLTARANDPAVAAEMAAVAEAAPGADPLTTLLGWMDTDAKVTPLKALQGMLWDEGYASGELQAHLYPDVAGNLRRWASAGVRLYVYSSGSVAAQRLLFRHTDDGDLIGLFSGFFDTRVGAKRETASYAAIATAINLPPGDLLFLSDVEAELDAAVAAGLSTCQLVREDDGTRASDRHAVAADFNAVDALIRQRIG